MWFNYSQAFAKRLRISLDEAKLFRCTAEHKVARKDGGKHTRGNIAASCWDCNHRRHADNPNCAMDHLTYSIHVAWNVREGTWR
ncbi:MULTISPECIES: HNH endonuclease [unclassified Variovorax]|uniref:HNH endonuclease n=1 Tax=unclassified Variovorax TaxID=663243 RepID=UPI003F5115E1